MKKTAKAIIQVQGIAVSIVAERQEDNICLTDCLTDVARYKGPERSVSFRFFRLFSFFAAKEISVCRWQLATASSPPCPTSRTSPNQRASL